MIEQSSDYLAKESYNICSMCVCVCVWDLRHRCGWPEYRSPPVQLRGSVLRPRHQPEPRRPCRSRSHTAHGTCPSSEESHQSEFYLQSAKWFATKTVKSCSQCVLASDSETLLTWYVLRDHYWPEPVISDHATLSQLSGKCPKISVWTTQPVVDSSTTY